MNSSAQQQKMGIFYTLGAYTAWGLLPVYWKLLDAVPPLEILAHRILWSFVFTTFLLILGRGRKSLAAVKALKKRFLPVFLCGILISLNWYTYIWAVNSNRVIEASMGYYINPLMVVLLSVAVLKEKLSAPGWAATGLAAVGVLIITIHYGSIPWVALILAATFALYGLAKKLLAADSLTGLVVETSAVAPLALIYVFRIEQAGGGSFAAGSGLSLLLAGAGIITALPLLLFASGAKRIRFSTVGFFQYIAPSLTLILGIFVFNETFSFIHLVSFGFIWAGLLVFTAASTGLGAKLHLSKAKAPS